MTHEEKQELLAVVPQNWVDPLLTGPDAVFRSSERPEPNVERVLNAVRERLRRKLDELEKRA